MNPQALSRAAIGLAIRGAREAAGLSLRRLAAEAGISPALLSRTELGERDVGYVELLSIAETLKIDEQTLRQFALTFERERLPHRQEKIRKLNALQREAVATLIELEALARRDT